MTEHEAIDRLAAKDRELERLTSERTAALSRIEGNDYRASHMRDNTTPDELREIVMGLAWKLGDAESELEKLRSDLHLAITMRDQYFIQLGEAQMEGERLRAALKDIIRRSFDQTFCARTAREALKTSGGSQP